MTVFPFSIKGRLHLMQASPSIPGLKGCQEPPLTMSVMFWNVINKVEIMIPFAHISGGTISVHVWHVICVDHNPLPMASGTNI